MKKSAFTPNKQQGDVVNKIAVGLERISVILKVLLWEKAKLVNMSPIQIQILIFIMHHKNDLCNVSYLAKEYNVTKPTISDAIKTLKKKKLIFKDYSSTDSRSYTIYLTKKGKDIVSKTSDFMAPLKSQINKFDDKELDGVFKTISELIYRVNSNGILQVQRECYSCKFYKKNNDTNYCNLIKKELLNKDIQLDCSEYQENFADKGAKGSRAH